MLDAADVAGIRVLGLADVPEFPEAPETGATFAENALAKARDAADGHRARRPSPTTPGSPSTRSTGCPGCCRRAGRGRHGDDRANLELVLGQLADVPDDRRGAAFVCAAALVVPGGAEIVVHGEWTGHLVRAPRGHQRLRLRPDLRAGRRGRGRRRSWRRRRRTRCRTAGRRCARCCRTCGRWPAGDRGRLVGGDRAVGGPGDGVGTVEVVGRKRMVGAAALAVLSWRSLVVLSRLGPGGLSAAAVQDAVRGRGAWAPRCSSSCRCWSPSPRAPHDLHRGRRAALRLRARRWRSPSGADRAGGRRRVLARAGHRRRARGPVRRPRAGGVDAAAARPQRPARRDRRCA